MNKEQYEYCPSPKPLVVKEAFNDWKLKNKMSCRCVIHHRDDTDETRAYNEKYYERWGCNEDGTFEYGKYVLFMTMAEHVKHHHTGSKRSKDTCRRISEATYGKKRSDETKAKMSEARKGVKNPRFGKGYVIAGERNGMFGKHHTEEARELVRAAALKDGDIYKIYKNNGGALMWNAFRHALKIGLIDKEIYNDESRSSLRDI